MNIYIYTYIHIYIYGLSGHLSYMTLVSFWPPTVWGSSVKIRFRFKNIVTYVCTYTLFNQIVINLSIYLFIHFWQGRLMEASGVSLIMIYGLLEKIFYISILPFIYGSI